MRNYCISFFFLSFLGFISCKKNVFSHSTESTLLDTLFVQANDESLSIKSRGLIINRIRKIVDEHAHDSIYRKNLFKIANRYYNLGDYDNYKHVVREILDKSNTKSDFDDIGKANVYLADYYNIKSNPDSAYYFYFQAEKNYTFSGNSTALAETYLNKAILQHNNSDYIGSENSAVKALRRLRKVSNAELQYEAYNILGIINNELKQHNKSIEFHEKALALASKSRPLKANGYDIVSKNNIGVVLQNKGFHRNAIRNFSEALRDSKQIKNNNMVLYAMILDNYAYSEFKINRGTKILPFFYRALRIRDSLQIVPGIIISKIHLSEYFQKTNTELSKKFALEAYYLSKKNNLSQDQMSALDRLSEVDIENYRKYAREYRKVNDSLILLERKNSNKFARIEFETEELTIEKDKLVEQRKSLIYIGLGILTLGVFIFVIRFQAAKNRELVLIQEQQQANEEVYQLMLRQQDRIEEVRQAEKKRIAQELHDGVLGKLFGTRMNLGVLNSKSDEKAIADRVSYIDELKNVEQEIREISHDLSAEKAAIFNNFVLMVNTFIEGQRTVCQAAISIKFDNDIDWNTVDSTAKINLYRILQEAFQNVNKHANAQNVAVRFHAREGSLYLEIRDDGVGFNYARKKKGIGLINMNNRILNSKGTMEIETSPGDGTLLKFILPLA